MGWSLWGGGRCLQQQQKAEVGWEHKGEIFDSYSKITQTLLPECLHFYVLKHSELWKSSNNGMISIIALAALGATTPPHQVQALFPFY